MKAMWAGFLGVIVITIAAYFILGEVGYSTADRNSGNAVRLD